MKKCVLVPFFAALLALASAAFAQTDDTGSPGGQAAAGISLPPFSPMGRVLESSPAEAGTPSSDLPDTPQDAPAITPDMSPMPAAVPPLDEPQPMNDAPGM